MKSIRGKIFLVMFLMVFISLVILGGASIYLNYDSTIKTLEQTMKGSASISAERIAKELESYENVAIDAGSLSELSDPGESVAGKKKIIDERVELHGFKRGNIIGSDGISIFDGKDYSDRLYYQKAMQGETYISEPLISKITGELSIMIAAPIWENGNSNGKIMGVVYFVPPETFLNDIVSQIHISDNSAAYAINANGVTIADNTLETITTQNIEEEAKSDSSLKQLASIHAKMRQGENGFGKYEINGVKKFCAYAPIPKTDGWSIGITAPRSDFMGATYLSIYITLAVLFVSVIVASVVAFRLAGRIGNPIKICAMRLKQLAQGDLHSEIPEIRTKDETGMLADATRTIATTIASIIADIDWGLGEIAEGNLAIDSQAQELYVGDFQSLAASMYKILDHLTTTLQQINQSAEQVAAGSDQVSASAQALSQGATEQASAVEELAATITEVSDRIKGNARKVELVSEQADGVGKEIAESNQRMQDMLTAMLEISNSSSEIGKIIKTIEDIAFQTNILALNAAVEAARAGTAGKGFAVVADEVRNLASKSGEASKNTSELIESSLRSVENGKRIANETAQSLVKVVDGVKEVTGEMDKISSESSEQARSIVQITQGIDQISEVVQTNSATAEESAAASEELNGQAQMMKNLVGQFQFKDAGSSDVQNTQSF